MVERQRRHAGGAGGRCVVILGCFQVATLLRIAEHGGPLPVWRLRNEPMGTNERGDTMYYATAPRVGSRHGLVKKGLVALVSIPKHHATCLCRRCVTGIPPPQTIKALQLTERGRHMVGVLRLLRWAGGQRVKIPAHVLAVEP